MMTIENDGKADSGQQRPIPSQTTSTCTSERAAAAAVSAAAAAAPPGGGGGAAAAAVPSDSSSRSDNNDPSTSSSTTTTDTTKQQQHHQPRKIIRRSRGRANYKNNNKVPIVDPVLFEKTIKASNLPAAYSFEILKTVERIFQLQATHVALQLPEGLLLYATVLSDILQRLASPCLQQVSILGDVTYGACCVDDLGAKALGAQLLVHYGHSCLVQIQHTCIPCLYVFVEITIDIPHLVHCLLLTLQERGGKEKNRNDDTKKKNKKYTKKKKPLIYLLGTIQFRHALMEAQTLLKESSSGYAVQIPQAKPLSPGEVLGCTSPVLKANPTTTDSNGGGGGGGGCCNDAGSSSSDDDCCVVDTDKDTHFDDDNYDKQKQEQEENTDDAIVCFVADGRFHLESTLISNPHIPLFLRYDPYSKTMTEESYLHEKMKSIRYDAIEKARNARTFGILLGTLGRQGNPAIVSKVQQVLKNHNKKYFILLVSEITPAKLALFANVVDAWIQVACPRLSVDWGHYLSKTGQPVLNPYELHVCFHETKWNDVYPMDYYSHEGGPWSNYHDDTKGRQFTKLA